MVPGFVGKKEYEERFSQGNHDASLSPVVLLVCTLDRTWRRVRASAFLPTTQEGSGLCCQRSLWFFCLLGMEEEEGMTKTGAIFLLSIEGVGTEGGELMKQEDVYSGDDVQTHECEVGEGTWAGGCEET